MFLHRVACRFPVQQALSSELGAPLPDLVVETEHEFHAHAEAFFQEYRLTGVQHSRAEVFGECQTTFEARMQRFRMLVEEPSAARARRSAVGVSTEI